MVPDGRRRGGEEQSGGCKHYLSGTDDGPEYRMARPHTSHVAMKRCVHGQMTPGAKYRVVARV